MRKYVVIPASIALIMAMSVSVDAQDLSKAASSMQTVQCAENVQNDLNSQETKSAQVTQSTESTQVAQSTESAQVAQTAPSLQSIQDTQGIQSSQGEQTTQSASGNSDVQAAESDQQQDDNRPVYNNLKYNVWNNEVTIVGLDNPNISSNINLVIPAKIAGYPVTTINQYAFKGNTNIKSVVFNQGLKTIGYSAFIGCTNLTGKITIPSSVTSIKGGSYYEDNGAFQGTAISEVEIANGNTALTIEGNAFKLCKSLKKVTLSNRTTSIGDNAFNGDSSLADVVFSQGLSMTIGDGAFQDTGIKSLKLPTNVTSIGERAFTGCSALTSLQLSEGLKTIGKEAFTGCKNLTGQLVIPSTVTAINAGPYWDNTGAFENTSITEVLIKDGTNPIDLGCDTFKNCKSLKKVTLSNRIRNIKDQAFFNDGSLSTLLFKNGSYDVTIGSSAFDLCGITSLAFSNNVVSIGISAFNECKSLTSVTTGSRLKTIGDKAFLNCSALKSLSLNEGLTTIGTSAFRNCTKLTGKLTIPSTVTEIKGGKEWDADGAFQNTAITEVLIKDGNSSLTLGSNIFNGCKQLAKVTLPDRMKEIGAGCFQNDAALKTVTFKNGKNAITIGDNAFSATGITSLILSGNVTSMGYKAFYGCKSLKSVTLNEGLQTIGSGAFLDCVNLTGTLSIPSTVTTIKGGDYYWINNGAFQNTNIAGVEIKDGSSAITLGNCTFADCHNLRYANLSNRMSNIGGCAFANDNRLAWVRVKNSNYELTIGDYAFKEASYLKVITLPRITKISKSVFEGCKKLKDVYYSSSQSDYNKYVSVDSYNTPYTSATKHMNSAGPATMPSTKYTGWDTVNGKSYWYENDVKQGYNANNKSYRGKEIFDPDSNAWYWLDNVQGGAKAVSKDVYQESSGGKWVRYDKDGHMVKGWNTMNNKKYYFDKTTGAMYKGLKKIDGYLYYFDQNTGAMLTGMVNVNGVEYGFDSNGKALNKKWLTKSGKSYWYEKGVRQGYDAKNKSYRGKEIYDPSTDGWYWLDNIQGGAKAVSKDVYQDSNGGKWVRYDSNGRMVKGWNNNNYFDLITGAMYKGWHNIDGTNYYFNKITGKRQ